MSSVALFIDYASMNRSATEIYTEGITGALQRDLDPKLLTDTIIEHNIMHGRGIDHVDTIDVYASLPNQRFEPIENAHWQSEFDRWKRTDSRTTVHPSLLDYPAGWPARRPRNRRSTVDLSAGVFEAVLAKTADVIVIASRATPLASTLDVLGHNFDGHVQLVSWETPRLRIDARTARCSVSSVNLNEDDWLGCCPESDSGRKSPSRKKPHQARRPVGIDMSTIWIPPLPAR